MPVPSTPDPFDFSEYSTSRDGTDTSPPDSGGPVWGNTPTFGGGFTTSPDPFGPGTTSATPDAFASAAPARSPSFAQGRTPAGWAAAALVTALAGVVLAIVALLGGAVGFAVAGWLLSGPTAALLLAKHMIADTTERALPVYQPSKAAQTLYRVAVGLAAAGIVASAWVIAEWAGRL